MVVFDHDKSDKIKNKKNAQFLTILKGTANRAWIFGELRDVLIEFKSTLELSRCMLTISED